MYVKRMLLKDFRSFSESDREYSFDLGRHITCISGHNGIGKSTMLAVLSNCGEIKASIGKHLNGDMFRGEYSLLIKGEKGIDTTGEKAVIWFEPSYQDEYFDDVPTSGLSFRAAFQSYKTTRSKYVRSGDNEDSYNLISEEVDVLRYRLIPRKTDEKKDERKLDWPTYYLGLSRLYPVGESNEVRHKKHNLPEYMAAEFNERYQSILNMKETIEQSEGLTLSDATNKKGIGVKTTKYGPLANSSGQDNLGQMIMTILSFQKLKASMGKSYRGGIFLIDEIDATLHPAAQNKLFDYLYKKSKELNLQIVFTTHSLSLITHIQKTHKLSEKNNSLVLLYLRNSRGAIDIVTNPSVKKVEYDLLNQYGLPKANEKIKVLTEDDTARWFLQGILNHYGVVCSLHLHDCTISVENIAKLITGDPDVFREYISVLDPDAIGETIKNNIKNLLSRSPFRFCEQTTHNQFKVLCLPGVKRIETIFWEYTENLPEDHAFYYDKRNEVFEVTKRSFVDERKGKYPDLSEKDKHKRWFHDNSALKDVMFDHWILEHDSEARSFVNEFIEVYNKIANMRSIPLTAFPEKSKNEGSHIVAAN